MGESRKTNVRGGKLKGRIIVKEKNEEIAVSHDYQARNVFHCGSVAEGDQINIGGEGPCGKEGDGWMSYVRAIKSTFSHHFCPT